jgi:DNA-binding CsgD family transcriptional regulator
MLAYRLLIARARDAFMTQSTSEYDREQLHELVSNAITAPLTLSESQELWRCLRDQRLAVVANFLCAGHAHLLLAETEPSLERRGVDPKAWRIFESVMLGAVRKALCFDLNLCTSTLAQGLKQTLVSMGLSCSPARVPPVLALLAHAAIGSSNRELRISRVELEGHRYIALSANLYSEAWDQLSAAERTVLELRAIGKSHADIAEQRKTSRRTVANQLAAATHRLGVSGRFDLLRMMASAP